MADGITGLNPIRAKQQIEELNINLSSVQNDFVQRKLLSFLIILFLL